VTVDVFEGTIQVFPSGDGMVSAKITNVAVSELSPADAEEALGTIDLDMDHQADSIRIVARGATRRNCRLETHVELRVPDGVRLDVRTGRGDIRIGRDYRGSTPVHLPIRSPSIRARNDSKHRIGYAEGNIIVEASPPLGAEGGPAAVTRLQLDACGKIEIIAVDAIVEARAWHGVVPKGWDPPSTYEDGFEGSISFEGTLAEKEHSFRAAHGLELKLGKGTALVVEAESGGKIAGDLIPAAVDHARWTGKIGEGPAGHLRLRSDSGPISLLKAPDPPEPK
jgi:hypothetical protein